MSFKDILEPVKSCIFLESLPFIVPVPILTNPPIITCSWKPRKIGYLDDIFELSLTKLTDSRIVVWFSRTRQTKTATRDDGYILRFNFTMVGFEEDTKVVLMRHDKTVASVDFTLSKTTLDKLANPTSYVELFVVVQMLEIKSLDEREEHKKAVKSFEDIIRNYLTREGVRRVGFILQNPEITDVFTGRMPKEHIEVLMCIVGLTLYFYNELYDYLSSNSTNKNAQMRGCDLGTVLHYLAFNDKSRPIPDEEIMEQYLAAHKLGLEFYKTLTSDYLSTLLERNHMVLDILEAAITVHDTKLLEKAMYCFLNHFHEITLSEKFRELSENKGHVARFIIHAAHMFVLRNDVDISGWRQSEAQSATQSAEPSAAQSGTQPSAEQSAIQSAEPSAAQSEAQPSAVQSEAQSAEPSAAQSGTQPSAVQSKSKRKKKSKKQKFIPSTEL